MEEKYIIDDRIVISDAIMQMNDKELDEFIAEREKAAKERHEQFLSKQAAVL